MEVTGPGPLADNVTMKYPSYVRKHIAAVHPPSSYRLLGVGASLHGKVVEIPTPRVVGQSDPRSGSRH